MVKGFLLYLPYFLKKDQRVLFFSLHNYLLDESAGIIWGRVFFEENFEFYRSHETFVQPKKFCLNHMRKNFHLCIYRQQWHQVVCQILFQPNWKWYKYDFRIYIHTKLGRFLLQRKFGCFLKWRNDTKVWIS